MVTETAFKNPFSDYRWELESNHHIWLPPSIIQKVSSSTPVFLSGTRGTGKTTLLQVLDPRVRQHPSTLVMNPEHLNSSCIGVYVYPLGEYIELFKTACISRAKAEHIFNLYIFALSFAEVFEALRVSRSRLDLSYDPISEQQIAAHLDAKFGLSSLCPGTYPPGNFKQLRYVFNSLCEQIRTNLLNDSIEEILPQLVKVSPGALHRECAMAILRHRLLESNGPPRFIKVCIDDAHRIPEPLQPCLNTIVQEARSPISWCVSFVAGRYILADTRGGDVLSGDDRIKVELSYPNKDAQLEFRAICRNLFVARVKRFGGDQSDVVDVDLEAYGRILGRADVNTLFEMMLSDPTATKLRTEIMKHAGEVGLILRARADERLNRVGPRRLARREHMHYLYQTYLCLRLFNGNIESFRKHVAATEYEDLNNYFRQKGVAALICAADEIGIGPPYYGSFVCENLADGCVREFLKLMMQMFDAVAFQSDPRSAFSMRRGPPIALSVQFKAIKEAAGSYLENLRGESEGFSYYHVKLLLGLGHFTRLLQTRNTESALKNPDLGRIRVSFADPRVASSQLAARVKGALLHGVSAGSIRQISGFNGLNHTDFRGQVEFRLHKILAAHCAYSYRGPFRSVRLSLADLNELVRSPELDDLERWAEAVHAKVDIVDTDDNSIGRFGQLHWDF